MLLVEVCEESFVNIFHVWLRKLFAVSKRKISWFVDGDNVYVSVWDLHSFDEDSNSGARSYLFDSFAYFFCN